jgi:Outer membrane protein beta-barrel domain
MLKAKGAPRVAPKARTAILKSRRRQTAARHRQTHQHAPQLDPSGGPERVDKTSAAITAADPRSLDSPSERRQEPRQGDRRCRPPAQTDDTAQRIKAKRKIRGPAAPFAFDRFLAYGTAGWAWGNPLMSCALVGWAPFVNQGGRSTGWTAGGGVDYAITQNVFARIEYRYTSLTTASFVSAATNSAEAANRVPINDLRAGIAFGAKFNAVADIDPVKPSPPI